MVEGSNNFYRKQKPKFLKQFPKRGSAPLGKHARLLRVDICALLSNAVSLQCSHDEII